eukprot:GHVS01040013.1.p1 GENE.GHVS01040013.1~~GHVS01040013.1.p1  ORF type:complete len:298 (+),score=16.16 GHVS01040013.1:134-895(+)
MGAILIAYFVSTLSGTFNEGTMLAFVQHTAETKIRYSFGSSFLRGIGANSFVCLAVWMTLAVDDVAGKVLVLWFPIVAFVMAGFEHVIANFYTISLGLMYNCDNTLAEAIVNNFIPVLLGNIVGGCIVVGVVYWYTCHDSWAESQFMGKQDIAREASMLLYRAGTFLDGGKAHELPLRSVSHMTSAEGLRGPADSVTRFLSKKPIRFDTNDSVSGQRITEENPSARKDDSTMTSSEPTATNAKKQATETVRKN